MSNETDNVLVNCEQYEAMLAVIKVMAGDEVGFVSCVEAKAILAMPDFIESERDVGVAAKAIAVEMGASNETDLTFWKCRNKEAKAVINTLAYKGGGE